MSSTFAPGLFAGKVALVTGGGTGIGFAIAEELVRLGARVVIASRNVEKLELALTKLRAIAGSAEAALSVQCDIRKEDEVRRMIEFTVEKAGKLNFCVNNAGGQYVAPASALTLKGWCVLHDSDLTRRGKARLKGERKHAG